jgi:hypothetical protein
MVVDGYSKRSKERIDFDLSDKLAHVGFIPSDAINNQGKTGACHSILAFQGLANGSKMALVPLEP